ncbi:N-acetyltransferase [Aureimonas fodinaquatilis]|uniref:N-acetyltransferase n=1 Tax=Aureimonas fodinaquatilis TaxID=2565783 RepID=A0A5B0DTC5_9HYPH|nr:GNAT family N-acetyltransferase [Aureimonas fodinaquatilis]KAA0969668.1 N-acetyltransferase [Aureimonas fodinaquatilis]
MDIRHEAAGNGGRFLTGTGAAEAELSYASGTTPGTVVFNHTFVPPALRGQGVAEKLLEAAVAHARDHGWKIYPTCSYVQVQFARHPEKYANIATAAA